MPTTLGRNLHLCFTKIKRPLSPQSSPPFHHRPSFLFKSFNSLYDYDTTNVAFDSTSKSITRTHSSDSESEPDFATVFASQRFFFASPGRSNSIIESTPSLDTAESSDTPIGMISPRNDDSNQSSDVNLYSQDSFQSLLMKSTSVKDSVAVHTDSPDPYMDFRRSMQEMVEARDLVDVKANWDYLHELLLCYLALNPKSTHKFIISAFADLLVSLMSSTSNDMEEEEVSCSRECE
ncbi:transcription repressor OFP16-like [Mangifera indica]|uniref:transcription repressor OFP16-like n=1 Tax=Mangifera indica TaxID=29780 RepID=UPI001CFC080E|nr:transcription repressor OFP16-like [Mangifera indica]